MSVFLLHNCRGQIILNNVIITISTAEKSNLSLTLVTVCFISFLANELNPNYKCTDVNRESVTKITINHSVVKRQQDDLKMQRFIRPKLYFSHNIIIITIVIINIAQFTIMLYKQKEV